MYQYQLSFKEAVTRAFNKYCVFTGRASRSEYWWFALFNYIVGLVLALVCNMLFSETFTQIVIYAVSLVLLLPGLGLFWRRMHDIGKSGIWFLLGFIPIIGAIILIIWLCKPSQTGANQYGPEPNIRDMQ